MSLSNDQISAFEANSGFLPEQLGNVILGFLFVILLIWGVWAMKTAYSGWITKQISHKEFVLVGVRFAVIYCVLTFLLLS